LTLTLIVANVLVWLSSDPDQAARTFGAVAWHYTGMDPAPSLSIDLLGRVIQAPPIPREHPWLRVFTHMFVHSGFLHLLGNVWFLWIFADNVEDRLGRGKALVLYALSGLAALTLQIATHPSSGLPMVGASGAISGVLGAYAVAFPASRIVTLVPILFYPLLLAVPARLFLIFWFGLQLVQGLASDIGSGVAWWAHIGGFVTGALLMLALMPASPRRVSVSFPDQD